jgi:SAM-dependent methyltransferase
MVMTRRTAILSGLFAAAARGQKHPDVPFVPAPPEIVDAMLDLAKVQSSDVVYDLGSGDGRIVIAAARKRGARGVGVEIDPDLVAESRERAARAGVGDKVKIAEQDFFQTDLRPATVIMVHLLPEVLGKLKPRFQQQLRPGARIVSFAFEIPDWKPAKVERINNRPIYLWTISGGAK